MVDLETIFTEDERAALALLTRRGFRAFTRARLDDVRELDTGRRRRTFRNRGRYDLVLALRRAEPPAEAPEIDPGTEPEAEAPRTDPKNG